MSPITTHILDTAHGKPADNVTVVLEYHQGSDWAQIAREQTDANGRVSALLADDFDLQPGTYRLIFDTSEYFSLQGMESFYPLVMVSFIVSDASQHYHVPLLISPYGYSTYRGS
jgi:5-hydroxyisourate hydrolase